MTKLALAVSLLIVSTSGCQWKENPSPNKGVGVQVSQGPRIRPLTDRRFERTPARLQRGQYLVEGLLQCFICHSDRDWDAPGAPPLPGKEGAGHVWGPWLVAPNITPDKETGAGTWTDDMLARAIREGIGHDDRVLHPQMWYGSFRSLSDEDLASVIVYLRSIPPVHNPLPRTILPEEVKKEIQIPEPLTEPVPEPDLSDPVKRGRYLVNVADCVGCHTAWEAPLNPGFFGGGNLVERGSVKAFSANLTPDPSGISYYDDALFRQAMRTGQVKARKISSVMPWVVFRNLNDEDLRSIFAYLRTRRPVSHVVDNAEPPTECPMCEQAHGFGDRNHPKIDRVIKVDPETYDAYVGQYRFEDGFILTITKEGDKLMIQEGTGGPEVELLAVSENEFTAPKFPGVISFVKDNRGYVHHFITNVDDVAEKIR